MSERVCVCVCVCVRERESEKEDSRRETARENVYNNIISDGVYYVYTL